MTEPPAPSWPTARPADPHVRPVVVVLASAIGVTWCLVVLVAAVWFGLHPSATAWRHADPTDALPHGRWWRVGLASGYAAWCALGVWFAVATYLRRGWAAVALFVSALLAFALSGYELRAVVDLPVPLGALTVLVLLLAPPTRAWFVAGRVQV